MADWSHRLPANHHLQRILSARRIDTYRTIQKLGLPVGGELLIQPLCQFLEDTALLDSLRSSEQKFYMLLENNKEILCKIGITVPEVEKFCKEKLNQDFEILLVPFLQFCLEGSIIVRESGQVFGELTSGSILGISRGRITPEYSFHSDPFLGTMKYSFEDKTMRNAVWRTLQHIIAGHANGRPMFLKGYYEFALTDALDPVFLDAREGSLF